MELLYALHLSKSFNGGNIEFGEIVKAVESVLKIDLGNFYKTVSEIKSRKITKTKFLQLLSDNLINEIKD
ncbi:RteC domain-containing protein [Chryseobacterium shandongense]|uniref:RteC domain-containing protein n=1 Tax=Chryseobacterium shandongense TaxID=1493872 RepID=UPI0026AD91C4